MSRQDSKLKLLHCKSQFWFYQWLLNCQIHITSQSQSHYKCPLHQELCDVKDNELPCLVRGVKNRRGTAPSEKHLFQAWCRVRCPDMLRHGLSCLTASNSGGRLENKVVEKSGELLCAGLESTRLISRDEKDSSKSVKRSPQTKLRLAEKIHTKWTNSSEFKVTIKLVLSHLSYSFRPLNIRSLFTELFVLVGGNVVLAVCVCHGRDVCREGYTRPSWVLSTAVASAINRRQGGAHCVFMQCQNNWKTYFQLGKFTQAPSSPSDIKFKYTTCWVDVIWCWNMADENKHWVDGNLIFPKYIVIYMSLAFQFLLCIFPHLCFSLHYLTCSCSPRQHPRLYSLCSPSCQSVPWCFPVNSVLVCLSDVATWHPASVCLYCLLTSLVSACFLVLVSFLFFSSSPGVCKFQLL